MILQELGIKAPSLYSHYPSKQAILTLFLRTLPLQYEKYTDEIDIHVHDARKDIKVFSEITEDFLVRKVQQIFTYSLHNEKISRFRCMMTIEQFRSPELSKLYTERYVERLVRYHASIFENLIAAGEIKNENPETLAMMYVSPVITLLGVCDRQPEREEECIKS